MRQRATSACKERPPAVARAAGDTPPWTCWTERKAPTRGRAVGRTWKKTVWAASLRREWAAQAGVLTQMGKYINRTPIGDTAVIYW
jgi:hypothetical protein